MYISVTLVVQQQKQEQFIVHPKKEKYMMKSFVKNERNQNYLEHVLHHLVNILGFLHNGQNAMLFVVMELSQGLLFVVNLMEILLRKLMILNVMLNKNLKLNVNAKDL